MHIDTRSGAADDRSPTVRRIAAMLRLAYGTVVGLVVVAAACGGDSAVEGSFVGRVNGTDALLALLATGDEVAGYLSDGDRVSVWLRSGEIDGEDMALETRDGEPQGVVRIGREQLTGQMELDRSSHAFTLEPAEHQAGLYRGFADFGDGGTVEAGWIALADGTQLGAIATDGPGGLVVGTAEQLDVTSEFIRHVSRGSLTVELAVDRVTPDLVDFSQVGSAN